MRHYTFEEGQFVKDNYKNMTYEQIGNHLGRTRSSVLGKIKRLGLDNKKLRYTPEEEQFIVDNNTNMTAREIGECLGRTKHSIQMRAVSLGLANPAPLPIDKEELTRLTVEEGLGTYEVAKRLGCFPGSVTRWKKRLNLPNNWPEHIITAKRIEGEAKLYFRSRGMVILERGTFRSPFDWIVQDGEENLAVNVKGGQRAASIKPNNIMSLTKYGVPSFLIAKRDDDEVKRWYLLKLTDIMEVESNG